METPVVNKQIFNSTLLRFFNFFFIATYCLASFYILTYKFYVYTHRQIYNSRVLDSQFSKFLFRVSFHFSFFSILGFFFILFIYNTIRKGKREIINEEKRKKKVRSVIRDSNGIHWIGFKSFYHCDRVRASAAHIVALYYIYIIRRSRFTGALGFYIK